jgi:hypothetical protein
MFQSLNAFEGLTGLNLLCIHYSSIAPKLRVIGMHLFLQAQASSTPELYNTLLHPPTHLRPSVTVSCIY